MQGCGDVFGEVIAEILSSIDLPIVGQDGTALYQDSSQMVGSKLFRQSKLRFLKRKRAGLCPSSSIFPSYFPGHFGHDHLSCLTSRVYIQCDGSYGILGSSPLRLLRGVRARLVEQLGQHIVRARGFYWTHSLVAFRIHIFKVAALQSEV